MLPNSSAWLYLLMIFMYSVNDSMKNIENTFSLGIVDFASLYGRPAIAQIKQR